MQAWNQDRSLGDKRQSAQSGKIEIGQKQKCGVVLPPASEMVEQGGTTYEPVDKEAFLLGTQRRRTGRHAVLHQRSKGCADLVELLRSQGSTGKRRTANPPVPRSVRPADGFRTNDAETIGSTW